MKGSGNSDGANPWEMTVHLVNPGMGSIDEKEVRRALGLLVDPEHFVQIQSLPSARYKFCHGGDIDAMVKATAELSGEKGVYFSLNPLRGGLEKAARNLDVLSRRWLLIDPDARKPEDLTRDASTTDDEKECARLVTEAIREYLRDSGWPDPIYVDSGNNWQLLYRVDLPNDKLSQQLLSRTLKSLGERFDTDRVKLDRGVHDARRICKIPGTMVRKGDGQGDRPHRMSRLMSVPMGFLVPVDLDCIKAVAKVDLPQKKPGREPGEDDDLEHGIKSAELDPWMMTIGHSDDRKAYAVSALQREIGIVATATEPGRNRTLYLSALKLGTLVGADLLDEFDVKQQLDRAGQMCGLGQDGDPREIMRAIDNGFGYGVQHPRQIPERPPSRTRANLGPVPGIVPDGLIIIRGSEVVPRKVEWLWPGRIPLGKLTTFAGVGGLGKTFVLCDISARITRGDSWPDSDGECVTAGQVIFVSGEDDPDDTLVPRMMELDAVLERIIFLKTEVQDRFTLADLPILDKAIEQAGPGVSLVVIDPPTAYLGGVDDHKNSELRALLSPLKSWASRHRVAVVFNTHVSKPQGAKVEAMMRVMGSVAWVNAVRAAHMFAKDPDDPSRRIFVGMKLNIGKERNGLAYRIVETETLARVEWLGEVDVTADEAVGGDKKKSRGVVAVEWLADQFRKQRVWRSDELKANAREAGLSKNALWSPEAGALPIRKIPNTTADGEKYYTWVANEGWPPELEPEVEYIPEPLRETKRESGKTGKQEHKPLRDNTNNAFPIYNEDRENKDSRESRSAFPTDRIPDPGKADRESWNSFETKGLGDSFPAFPLSREGVEGVRESSRGPLITKPNVALKFLVSLLSVRPTPFPRVVECAAEFNIAMEAVHQAAAQLDVIKSTVDDVEVWDIEEK